MGAHRIKRLLQSVDHPQDIFRLKRNELLSVDGIGPSIARNILNFNEWQEVDRVLEETEKTGAEIVTYEDEAYPPILRQVYDPPVLFWLKGDKQALQKPSISVVGTRRVTSYGKKMAELFTRKLVEKQLMIVSGLALGVDSIAHRTTVDSGGITVAVLGSGIDWIYPNKHIGLAREIVESGGAVISEFPPGAKPDAPNFPVRNRIVSGLSLGTLVVESGREGGSMITAKSALDQNREVFVVPHSVDNYNGRGCNYLIQNGQGKLVQQVEDILAEIAIFATDSHENQPQKRTPVWRQEELDSISTLICEALEETPLHIDALSEQVEVPVQQLLPKLLELEMRNCVNQSAGKIFELKTI